MTDHDFAQSPFVDGSRFLRLALQGIVLAYVAGALVVIALEFQATITQMPFESTIVLATAFTVLETAALFSALQIFRSILR